MKYFRDAICLAGMISISLTAAIPRPDTKASTNEITNSYIVVLKDEISSNVLNQHLLWLGKTSELSGSQFAGQMHRYNIGNFKGYAGEFNELTVKRIKARPEVAFIEKNGIVKASGCVRQSIEPYEGEWGLGRISHLAVGPSNQYLYEKNGSACNTPVFAYLIDSGIQTTHEEFEGRATQIFKADPSWSDGDNCGHGTHVAGTIAGKTYGVQKTARIYSVKVLTTDGLGACTGEWGGIIAGLNFAYNHAGPGNRSRSIINMSLGASRSESTNRAVNNCVAGNMTVVVSAGNSGYDACSESPASASRAITVGATNILDVVPKWSNIGCCVDIYGPGSDIKSSFSDDTDRNDLTQVLNGTSMASPYIAGIILYNKCLYNFDTPKKDRDYLVQTASSGTITGNRCIKGCCSPNSLGYNGGCVSRRRI